ncbi:PLP-dependent aminotransferase family protein [Pyxidicoccus fallax]|uniref:PLP-dependent aminotransferase family protein n=1 Tax=Pyxidicoccus fallax TaxID=394095 RepID=A0A848L897_9BACT|nr:PLP-dependent aminotransferase family protein [Pyxidicoccus fallax]NMO15220.1 PLP-dependent aminotransferase family protein [Pyxidicoccus fallax]NPC76919.1 PLP-dependent aminotransferase family protein [Pyxidicoccus fallax]
MTSWAPRLRGRDGPLYRVIADELAADIEEGRLAPGTRLPTHRELAEKVGVTVGTVTRAYAEAERRGLIGGEVGRGTFVRHRDTPRHLPTPAPDMGDDALVELGLNWPATPPGDPAGTALRKTLDALQRSPRLSELLDYQPHAGLLAHREAGAAWLSRFGVEASPEQVVVCSGGQHAMEVALTTLTRPGDTVLAEALTYPGLKVLANRLHLRLHGVAMDEQGLKPDALEAACRTGAKVLFCLPNLQNPTGAVMPEERRRRIATVVRKHGLTVVEDDAYGLLLDRRPPPLWALVPESCWFIGGVSKLLAPGLRIGYLAAPAGAGVARLAEEAGLAVRMTPPLMAEVAARWVEDGTADELVARRRREAQERLELAREVLGDALPKAPRGPTYHLWLPLPGGWRAEPFTARARRRGVSVTPAEVFTVGPATAPAAVRVCLGAPRTRASLEKGLRRLRETLEGGPEPLASIV